MSDICNQNRETCPVFKREVATMKSRGMTGVIVCTPNFSGSCNVLKKNHGEHDDHYHERKRGQQTS